MSRGKAFVVVMVPLFTPENREVLECSHYFPLLCMFSSQSLIFRMLTLETTLNAWSEKINQSKTVKEGGKTRVETKNSTYIKILR